MLLLPAVQRRSAVGTLLVVLVPPLLVLLTALAITAAMIRLHRDRTWLQGRPPGHWLVAIRIDADHLETALEPLCSTAFDSVCDLKSKDRGTFELIDHRFGLETWPNYRYIRQVYEYRGPGPFPEPGAVLRACAADLQTLHLTCWIAVEDPKNVLAGPTIVIGRRD